MENKILYIFSLIFLLFFIMELLFKKEFFNYCPNCNQEGERNCYNCQNCGWCIDSNYNGECIKGDKYGPYYNNSCKEWYYDGNKIYPNYRIIKENTEKYPIFFKSKKKNRSNIYIFLIMILIIASTTILLL